MATHRRIPASEITPRDLFIDRRAFLASAGASLAALAARGLDDVAAQGAPPKFARTITLPDALTPQKEATTFNNFYEFGIDKGDPARRSKGFKPRPWSVAVEGACGKPGVYTLADILEPHTLEERVYRHRCARAGRWSCRGSASRSRTC